MAIKWTYSLKCYYTSRFDFDNCGIQAEKSTLHLAWYLWSPACPHTHTFLEISHCMSWLIMMKWIS